ncbi:Vacuolar 14 Fab1-binding region [Fragilaria crotonensis]|nr:Vacuolar 14 Fab1-binding region [Fragilaria crotonensis]
MIFHDFCLRSGRRFRASNGTSLQEYLTEFLPAICSYGKSSRPPSDRSMAMGCLSEIAQELEGAIAEFWQPVFYPAILAGLADPDDSVKRNAAFAAEYAVRIWEKRLLANIPPSCKLSRHCFH